MGTDMSWLESYEPNWKCTSFGIILLKCFNECGMICLGLFSDVPMDILLIQIMNCMSVQVLSQKAVTVCNPKKLFYSIYLINIMCTGKIVMSFNERV